MMAVANETAVLKFSKVSENAFAPHKGSDKAAGYDLRSAYDYVVPARGKELIKTDISIELPPGKFYSVENTVNVSSCNIISSLPLLLHPQLITKTCFC